MKVSHRPKKVIREAWTITFAEWDQTPDGTRLIDRRHLFVDKPIYDENGKQVWSQQVFAPALKAWIDSKGETLRVEPFDCGDWGEGMPIVTIHFYDKAVADEFVALWGGR